MVRHTNSDHMWVCQVDVGGDAPIQIVTGAQNQQVGDLVPVALDGALLPDGKQIHAGTLRGEASNGMMCSLKELGLTLHDYPYAIEDGLWVMQEDGVKPGDDIAAVIGADDHVVEFEITPNRPDCLSVIGLAREAAVTFDKPLKLHTPDVPGCGEDIRDYVSIRIDDPVLCPRYTARMVKNVKIAPSPRWMRERLRNSGVRPINNIVDITNYVMLEYGQPMHAFDFSCIGGKQIIVRTAREGETIETLDGNARRLTPNMLCICDEQKPVAVAGVMGGANSEIVGDTAMVVFEGANFNGTSVRRTAAALGMRTEASGRFEKGLDPMNTVAAVDRACELVELLGCGEVMRGTIDVLPEPIVPKTVKLEPEKVNGLLGTDVSEAEMRRILLALGFELDGETIIVPSWRGDVEHYSDIAEEIARFYGYNNIPCTLMRGQTTSGGYSDVQQAERSIGAMARALGYSEIITYSFISPSYYDKIRLPADSPLRDSMKILNPLGEDTSIMRTTVLPSMLEILTRNYNYRNKAVRLYEIGKVYFARPDSFVFGEQVYQCRKQMGWQLAHESTPDVDFIMPFPDSGVYSAVGFAQCAELPYEHAMIRNHYVGRTFIQPTQSMRNFGVRVKINPVRSMIEGKKICIVDDSIVRGTTMITRVKKLRELGAKEVHIRISCPPVKFPCFYGIDFASRGELIAAKYSLPEITKMLDVDSLHYLSIDGLLRSVMQSDSYCLACFDGNYPVPCRESGKLRLECGGCCGSR